MQRVSTNKLQALRMEWKVMDSVSGYMEPPCI